MLSIRPRVASLNLHVFSRSLHPELFTVHRTKQVIREKYSAKIDITHEGHVVTFCSETVTLAEIACSNLQPLPQKRSLLNAQLGERVVEKLEAPMGIRYRSEFEMEYLSPEMFAMLQVQLSSKQKELELFHAFDSSGRIAMGAISYIHLETRSRSLTIQSLHTFPDDEAIVKVISTISLPKATQTA